VSRKRALIGEIQLPPPRDWQAFEHLCLLVWRELWHDPTAQKNGRRGQEQCGVDVFGYASASHILAGVQCKGRENYPPSRLTTLDLRREAARARCFEPALESFTIATTAPDDVGLQRTARLISARNRRRGSFMVEVWGWGSISTELNRHPRLLRELYSDIVQDPTAKLLPDGTFQFSIFPDDPLLELSERFEGRVSSLIRKGVREDVKAILSELCLNSFQHGGARHCTVDVRTDVVVFRDDGKPFNPLAAGEGTKGAGLMTLTIVGRKYEGRLNFAYETPPQGGNEVRLVFSHALTSENLSGRCVIEIDAPGAFYPRFGEHLGRIALIPADCDVVTFFVTPGMFNPSSLVMFVREVLRRIAGEVTLQLRFAPNDVCAGVAREIFKDQRVLVD
jgi:hypothetical protein